MARQQWSSRQTFIMAAIGSAVGLGNAWRFPGIAYQNGGGAFLIPYFVALLTAGIPLLALELSIGKRFQSGAPGALAKLNKKFEWIGWWGVVTAFCICAYYSVVLAWVIDYVGLSFRSPWMEKAAADVFTGDVLQVSSGMFDLGGFSPIVVIALVIGWFCMWYCIRHGVTSVGKIVKYTVILPVILLGILISSFIAGALGFVSLKPVSEAAWFHAPQLFFFGVPHFDMSAMITMILVSLTTMIESTGVFFALSDITGRQLTTTDLERGYRAEGIAAILGGLFNTFPYSTFSENVGVLKMSGVKSRQPVYYAAFLLLLLGLLPKVGALATVIPEPVLGGAMIVMFGMVGVQGVQILHKVDFSNNANLLTASVSIGLGLGITMYPQLFQHMPTEFQIILGNGIVVTSLSAVLLNLLFNHRWANHN